MTAGEEGGGRAHEGESMVLIDEWVKRWLTEEVCCGFGVSVCQTE